MRDTKYEIRNTKKCLTITAAISAACFVFCISDFVFAAPTGATLLKIGVGARAVGMGSAYTAVADDVTAIHWNPAGLSRLSQRQLAAMHSEWLSESRYDFIGVAVPSAHGSWGASALYLSQGGLERRDLSGTAGGRFNAYDAAAAVSYSRALSARLSAGAAVKYVRQGIDAAASSGYAADVGLQMRLRRGVRAGLAVQNLGSTLRFESEEYRLPLSVSGGVAVSFLKGILLAADVRQAIYESRTEFNLGTEYTHGLLSLRAGYQALLAGRETLSGKSAGFSAPFAGGMGGGIGFRLSSYRLDYALVPYGELGSAHRLSLSTRF
ncbi:MAG TPA: PorV/PorQ family protein [Elusimicrobiota bacterium]|nr:PorV/PorQ family protein [Elusimicrobiota bacterium]